MQIDAESKGKKVVPPKEHDKGKGVVPPLEVMPIEITPAQSPGTNNVRPEDPPSGKRRNCGHYHEVGGPTNFCKVIMALQQETIPMPLDFTKHFPSVTQEFKLKTNTGYS
ncbi:U-box domain-containing protein 4 [Hordeum vulgare]|nr:U-box domain-containing protein 4 [Hordeum vulgare]